MHCVELSRVTEDENLIFANDSSCDESNRPNMIQNCSSSIACPEWIVGPWSECSELCGEGVKNRSVTCSFQYPNDTTDNQHCDNLPYRPARYITQNSV